MGRKEKESNPMQAWRRKEKEKVSKARKKARGDKISEIPAYRRDPAPLVSEIYRLNVLDYEGRLNSDMKQHKKHLLDQFQSIKRARSAAGLETVELVEFDAEAYEAAKLTQLQKKRIKTTESSEDHLHSKNDTYLNENEKKEIEFPKLPESPEPTESELLDLGLPIYSPFPYVPDFEVDEEDEINLQNDNDDNNLDDLKSQLEAEYEIFKNSLNENE